MVEKAKTFSFYGMDGDTSDAFSELSPERKLGYAVLFIAFKDCYTLRTLGDRWQARVWLLSNSEHDYGAFWWADRCDLENFLSALRKLLKKNSDLDKISWCSIWKSQFKFNNKKGTGK